MPFTADNPDTVTKSPVSSYSHSNETSTQAYYSVLLDNYGVKTELTGSERSGIMRFTFTGDKYNCIFIRANSDVNQGVISFPE